MASSLSLQSTEPANAQGIVQGQCTVSILNQTANVQPDGFWSLPNIPANMGPVRARLNCVDDGVTSSGSSDFFTITANRMNAIPPIELGSGAPSPVSITLTLDPAVLTSAGETAQATVTAVFADDSESDVTAASEATTYVSTNPAVATVDADGQVTAVSSGRVLVTALHDTILSASTVTVLVGGDSDGDGLPDDYELANGLDPNDPVDALEDRDRDGLTHLDEFNLGTDLDNPDTDSDGLGDGDEVRGTGTNPALFDTDGDGVSDGLEIEVGTDPLDPASFDLSAVPFVAFEVAPSSFVLVVDGLTLDASRRLTVTGTLAGGTAIDLTPRSRGTRYSSSDFTVCNFGAEDGVVFAGRDGLCTVTVTNSGLGAAVEGEVTTFNPIARSALEIPGYANNVDVADGRAYVAAGAAGLVVVDAIDPVFPELVATFDTPGNANDVKLRDGRAFVADGSAGLLVVDVTNPLSPTLLSSLDTPGEARDVALAGELALVADGPGGLHVIDVRDPSAPLLLATLAIQGPARGVGVDGGLAVVAAGTSGVHVVDLADPSAPVLLASLGTADARDVDVVGSTAWLADFTGGLRSIDLSDPAAPRVLASVPNQFGGIPQDVVVAPGADRLFALTAEVFFANASVPIVEVGDPAGPLPRTVIDFGVDFEGTGLSVDETHVYLTATNSFADNGTTGESFLFIGQYLGLQDEAGVAPSARLLSPADGDEVLEGEPIVVEVEASDDVGLLGVRVRFGGEVVAEDRNAPYRLVIPAPAAPAVLAIDAEAIDFGGSRAATETVTVTVVAKATTSVLGSVADAAGAAVPEAAVSTNQGGAGSTDGGGFFRFDEIPADQGDVVVFATAERGGATLRGQSPPTAPVAGGFTDVGEIRVSPRDLFPGRKFSLEVPGASGTPSDGEPSSLAGGDFNGDGVTDWAAAGFSSRSRISVFLGRGDGTFEPVRHLDVDGVVDPAWLVAADLDGDSLSDLVAVHRFLDEVSVHLSLGDGTFEPVGVAVVGLRPFRADAADFDLDGVPDLAVANGSSGDVSLLLGLGDGRFAPETRLATGSSTAFFVADVDADGRADLGVRDSSEPGVALFFGRGDGTFEAPRIVPAGLRPTRVRAADTDGDGVGDLVAMGGHPVFNTVFAVVLRGLGDRTFEVPSTVPLISGPTDFQVADLDLDGLAELAFLGPRNNFDAVRVVRGDGSGIVETYPGAAVTLRFEDADLDGFPDLLVGGGGGLKVFRGDGSGSFASFVRHQGQSSTRLVAAGDVNVDGIVDLVQGAPFPQVVVHLGRPEGGFEAPAAYTSAHTALGLWVADVTGDGRPDLVTRSRSAVGVLPGLGDGTFGAPVESSIPQTLSNLEISAILADFDGDGLADFAGARDGGGEVVLMLNRGDGMFSTAQASAVGVGPRGLAAADFDGDGRLDLAVTNFFSRDVSVLLNEGGAFAPEIRQPLGQTPDSVVALDADLDGRPDLAIEVTSLGSAVEILRGQGNGTFLPNGDVPTDQPRRILAVDLDQDGVEDLVVANRADDVEVFAGRGDGTFGPGRKYTTGAVHSDETPAETLLAADLDGDGRLDLVVRGERMFHFLIRDP